MTSDNGMDHINHGVDHIGTHKPFITELIMQLNFKAQRQGVSAIRKDPAHGGIAEQLRAAGVGIAHFFGGGSYVKETLIPKGTTLAQHAHDHDHLSYLVSGTVKVIVDGAARTVTGPACMTIGAGKVHGVVAETDAVWLCIWATECEDPETVDDVLTGSHA